MTIKSAFIFARSLNTFGIEAPLVIAASLVDVKGMKIDDDRFTVTFENRLLSYKLHFDTVAKLRRIVHTLFSAFE